jgi:outer membrane protein assembly factor BamB
MKSSVSILAVLSLWALATVQASDWPRLGGPDGLGISSETGLIRTWPETGPRELWSVDVAEGFAGPAVCAGQVYLLDRVDDKQDVLRCLDLKTGNELWRLGYDAPGRLPFNGSRNVPTVEGQYIFTVGPLGHFHCIDRQTHQVVWSKHLVNDFKDPEIDVATPPTNRLDTLARAQVPMWGMTQAPLVYKDTVIVAPQTQKTGLVAYDQATGSIRWRSDYIGRNWYSHVSPTLMTLGGLPQVIMLAQPSDPEKSPAQAPPALITSVAADTGRILWSIKTPAPYKIPIPQPLRVADDRIFITGGYGLGGVMFQVAHTADPWKAHVLWRNLNVAGHLHSPILYQDRIYTVSFKEHGAALTGLACINLAGDPVAQTGPSQQFDFGAFLIADHMAIVMQGKTGTLHLYDLTGDGMKPLAKASVLKAENNMVWAPMALSDGKLLVRDQHQLKCLELKP